MYNDEQLQNSQDSNIEKTWSKKLPTSEQTFQSL